jgi:hypothetical protein
MVALSAAPSLAGGVFRMSEGGGATEVQTMYVQDGMLRIDDRSNADQVTSVIFKGGELLIINPEESNYYRMTPETFEQLGAALGQMNQQMSAVMQQMQQQLANLPPQQREMMERMMRSRMPNLGDLAAVRTIRVEQGGSSTVGSYACTDYTIFANDERVQEICAADFASVPGSSEIAAVLSDMQTFFAGLREAMRQSPVLAGLQTNPFQIISQIQGMPVRTRQYRNDAVAQELVLSSAESTTVDAGLFAPPAAYSEQSFPIPEMPTPR